MPISITGRVVDGLYLHCPVFICDHCGKQIEDTSQGILDYGHVGKGVDASGFRILHNHLPDGSTACSRFYRQFNSVMLKEFTDQLLHNSNHKPAK